MSEKQPQPVAEALRAEILKLATDGDQKSEGALTAEILMRIMRVAKTGRDLLVSLSVSPSNLAGMIKRPNPFGMSYSGQETMDDSLGLVDVSMGGAIMPYASSPQSENFGMTAIREIIAATKNLNGNGASPAKLVEALVIARKEGLDDVVRELEMQLGVGKDKVVVGKALEPELEKKELVQ